MNDILSGFMKGLTVEVYLFGSNINRDDQLTTLISQLISADFAVPNLLNPTLAPEALAFLESHPRRLLDIDEILAIMRGEMSVDDVLQVSVEDLCGQKESANKPHIYRKLGHCLLKRFWRFGELDDLEGGICYLKKSIPLTAKNDYRYLEVLLGLCCGFWQRFQMLGQKDDQRKLLDYLLEQKELDFEAILRPCRGECLRI